jgi:hypothetical protein
MKMYKKPATEVTDLKTVGLMQQTITVSLGDSNNTGGTPPPVQAPMRGDIID